MFEIPLLLILIVLVALVFDFTNGAHDCANAIATVVSTKVVTPRFAVGMAAALNLAGALLGTEVAKTLGAGLVLPEVVQGSHILVLAALLELPHLVFRHPLVVLPCAHRRPGGCRSGPCRA